MIALTNYCENHKPFSVKHTNFNIRAAKISLEHQLMSNFSRRRVPPFFKISAQNPTFISNFNTIWNGFRIVSTIFD